MRRPQGYATWTGPSEPGGQVERDTATCVHCNRVWFVPPRATPADSGGWCSCCNGPTCPKKTCNNGCTPFLKKLDLYERSQRFAQDAGLVLD